MANNKAYLKIIRTLLSTSILVMAADLQADVSANYQVKEAKKIDINGDFDFLSLYEEKQKILAGHDQNLAIIDNKTLEKVSDITLSGHGHSMVVYNGRGYVSLDNKNSVEVVDLDSRKSVSIVSTLSGSPGHGVVDHVTNNLFLADRKDSKILVVNLTSGSSSSISVSGNIDSMVSNQRGYIFASIKNKPVIEVIDTDHLKSLGEINLLGCASATGLDIDIHERRLFVACTNGWMQILDTDTGYRLNRLKIAEGGAQVGLDFEPDRIVNIFSLTENGELNVGKVKKVTFSSEQTLKALGRKATMLVDDDSGSVFVASGNQIQVIKNN